MVLLWGCAAVAGYALLRLGGAWSLQVLAGPPGSGPAAVALARLGAVALAVFGLGLLLWGAWCAATIALALLVRPALGGRRERR
ncbi:hypothetical protein [Streptomyces sp. NPDC018045]|uniref:hypothetical protein n=1 Tax=Streptomyces sp. NPDC018045 TaxID=3365037 RepID=UPI00378E7E77